MATIAVSPKTILKRFTAVDLVTIAVFAAIWRGLWYLWNAFSFLFPFNQVLNTFFYGICAVAAMVIVRKVGTATLFTIAALLINVLLQGESLAIAAIAMFTGIFGDVYAWIVLAGGQDPFVSRRQMFIVGILLSLGMNIALWVLMLKLIYKIPMPNGTLIAAFVSCTITGIIGGWLGFKLGDRVKGLLG
jgi:hypothetical protein